MSVWELICSKINVNQSSNGSQLPLVSQNYSSVCRSEGDIVQTSRLVRLERQVQRMVDQCTGHALHFQQCAQLAEITAARTHAGTKPSGLSLELAELRTLMRMVRRCRNGSDAVNRTSVRAMQKKADRLRERILFARLELIFVLRKVSEELSLSLRDFQKTAQFNKEIKICDEYWERLVNAVEDSCHRDAKFKRSVELEILVSQVHQNFYNKFRYVTSALKRDRQFDKNEERSKTTKRRSPKDLLNPRKPENVDKINRLLRLVSKSRRMIDALHLGLHIRPGPAGEDGGAASPPDENNNCTRSRANFGAKCEGVDVPEPYAGAKAVSFESRSQLLPCGRRLLRRTSGKLAGDYRGKIDTNRDSDENSVRSRRRRVRSASEGKNDDRLAVNDCGERDISSLCRVLKTLQKWLECMAPFDASLLARIEEQIASVERHIDPDKSEEEIAAGLGGEPALVLASYLVDYRTDTSDDDDDGEEAGLKLGQKFRQLNDRYWAKGRVDRSVVDKRGPRSKNCGNIYANIFNEERLV